MVLVAMMLVTVIMNFDNSGVEATMMKYLFIYLLHANVYSKILTNKLTKH